MSEPARKTAPRKTTPRPSVAARAEVRGERRKAKPITVTFRGEKFDISRDRLGSERVQIRQTHLQQFRTVDSLVKLLFDLLGGVDSARFLDLMGNDDTMDSAGSEFLTALNKAASVPNS